jgi:hypothetical protein
MVYICLNRFISIDSADKGLAKIVLEAHKSLPIIERLTENFQKYIWQARYEYYIKYAFTPNL